MAGFAERRGSRQLSCLWAGSLPQPGTMAVVLQDVGAVLLSGWWAQCLWWSFGMSWLSDLLGV